MLYLFSGDDAQKKNLSCEKFIKSLPKGIETFFISKNGFDPTQVESFYSGASLFAASSAVVLERLLEYEEARDFILDKLKLMGESSNHFVFLEGKLNKVTLDAFKKARAEINVFERPEEKKERFDNFLLANTFANKDKLNTWIYFRQAVERGVSLEELVGVLFWKIKDTLLKRDFTKFPEEQLKDFVARLSYLLPEARKKGLDAESALEQFLLEAV